MPDTEGGDVFRVSINDMFINETDDPVEVTQSLMQDDFIIEDSYGEKAWHINTDVLL